MFTLNTSDNVMVDFVCLNLYYVCADSAGLNSGVTVGLGEEFPSYYVWNLVLAKSTYLLGCCEENTVPGKKQKQNNAILHLPFNGDIINFHEDVASFALLTLPSFRKPAYFL